MNILHINQLDIHGGAAIAAFRLHQSLLSQKIESNLLVDQVTIRSKNIQEISRRRHVDNLVSRLFWHIGLNYIHVKSTNPIIDHKFYNEATIINFHNLHGGYFNYLGIAKLTAKKPAVFTLHDMWSFTGHCAYSFGCDRWKTGCGECPDLSLYPAVGRDTTHWEWRLKKWTYRHSDLTIVTPSQWLANLAHQSILGQFPIYHIPYGLDTEAYQPLDPEICRKALGIALGKKVVMFAAQNLQDPRKGGRLLIESLQQLPESLKCDMVLLLLGEGGEEIRKTVGIELVALGSAGGDRLKSIAYSAADLFILPTRADNLPLVLQESMACGTPAVALNVGGVSDLVRPNITGYLADSENASSLAQSIQELLEDHKKREKMSHNCREIAVAEYSLQLQTKRYIELYEEIANRS
jgi:glycosyltransferase involved in cell wall biosynthesis